MLNVTVGQEVRVFRGDRRSPGEGQSGTVVRVGRRLFDVETDNAGYPQVDTYRLETGYIHSVYGREYVLTLEGVALAHRRQAAEDTLKDRRVILDPMRSRKLTTEQLEALAEVARTFPDES